MVIIWTLLGAIINPNYFLPYATAALTFLSFVATKFKSFEDKIKSGKAAILEYIDRTYGSFINKILVKMGINLMKNENDVLGKAQEIADSHAFQSMTSKFVEVGVLKKDDLESVTKMIVDLNSSNLNNDIDHVANHSDLMKKEFDDLTDKIVYY